LLSLTLFAAAAFPPFAIAETTYTERLTVVNNCGDNVWMWAIPPGPDVAEEQNQFWETKNGGTRVCSSNLSPCPTRGYEWKFEIAAGATRKFWVPDQGSAGGKFYFNMNCTSTGEHHAGRGKCTIGGNFGADVVSGDLIAANNWFEATWGCNDSTKATCAANPSNTAEKLERDWLDISLVDGYTVPMKMELGAGEATSHDCKYQGGTAWDGVEDLGFVDLASCPTESSVTMYSTTPAIQSQLNGDGISLLTKDSSGNYIHCAAPHKWLSTNELGTVVTSGGKNTRPVTAGADIDHLNELNWYGCKGLCGGDPKTPATCLCPECGGDQCRKGPNGNQTYIVEKSAYVKRLKAMGVQAYTWQYDDAYGLKNCTQGVNVTVTLCPAKTGQKPYDPNQKWKKDGSGACVIADSGESGYASYYLCKTGSTPSGSGKFLIWQNTSTGEIRWWNIASTGKIISEDWNTGHGSVSDETLNGDWSFAGTARVDGARTLFYHNTSDGSVKFWKLNDSAEMTSSGLVSDTLRITGNWRTSGVSVFNSVPTIFWQNTSTGKVVYWKLGNDAKLVNATRDDGWGYVSDNIAVKQGWRLATTTTLGGVNILYWQNQNNGAVAYWKLNSSNKLLDENQDSGWGFVADTLRLSSAWFDAGVVNSNSLLWQNQSSGKIVWWRVADSAKIVNLIEDTGWGYVSKNLTLNSSWFAGAIDALSSTYFIFWQNQSTGRVAYWKLNSSVQLQSETKDDGWGNVAADLQMGGNWVLNCITP
jgi:hypothetical protein